MPDDLDGVGCKDLADMLSEQLRKIGSESYSAAKLFGYSDIWNTSQSVRLSVFRTTSASDETQVEIAAGTAIHGELCRLMAQETRRNLSDLMTRLHGHVDRLQVLADKLAAQLVPAVDPNAP